MNLGEQTATDEGGTELGKFKSYMMALNGSFGMKIKEYSSIGFNFKVFHQKLAESYWTDDASTGGGSEVGDPFSTDFAFDVGYLTKFGKQKQHSFGLAIQNIGPPVSFVDVVLAIIILLYSAKVFEFTKHRKIIISILLNIHLLILRYLYFYIITNNKE